MAFAERRPRLIVALDFQQKERALALIATLDHNDCILKVGSEMFTLFGPDFIKELVARGFKVFLDLKFHDIPNTVAQACSAAAKIGVWMINVHAMGGAAMMTAAKNALANYGEKKPLLIAVTLLTSFSPEKFSELGVSIPLENYVSHLASLAKQSGLDGVVCSAMEVPKIKALYGESFLTVTPGIRLDDDSINDQARVVNVKQAIKLGSDYLVVGRSITAASKPEAVVKKILLTFLGQDKKH